MWSDQKTRLMETELWQSIINLIRMTGLNLRKSTIGPKKPHFLLLKTFKKLSKINLQWAMHHITYFISFNPSHLLHKTYSKALTYHLIHITYSISLTPYNLLLPWDTWLDRLDSSYEIFVNLGKNWSQLRDSRASEARAKQKWCLKSPIYWQGGISNLGNV